MVQNSFTPLSEAQSGSRDREYLSRKYNSPILACLLNSLRNHISVAVTANPVNSWDTAIIVRNATIMTTSQRITNPRRLSNFIPVPREWQGAESQNSRPDVCRKMGHQMNRGWCQVPCLLLSLRAGRVFCARTCHIERGWVKKTITQFDAVP